MWEMFHALSDPFAIASIGTFLIALTLNRFGYDSTALRFGGLAWGLFGAFWLAMFPYYYFEFSSPLESVLSLAAVPLCLYAGYLLASSRASLWLLSKAVAIMGLVYLPVLLIAPIEQALIELVTVQTHSGMELVGYSPGITEGPNGNASKFDFGGYTTYIVTACTGIGSIAIFGGLIAATAAPIRRKLTGLLAAIGIIWILNLMRNVFVGLAAPLGWFDYPTFEAIAALLGGSGVRTSFFVSHHLISQSLSVVALIGITLLVIRIVPEVLEVLEEALFVVTGSTWGLTQAIDTGERTAEPGR